MAMHAILVFIFTMCVSLHEGLGLPLTGQSDPSEPAPAHKVRSKRCSCSMQLDSECHYFCHLDIIWVNTPGKTTVYGLGSPLARRRRSTGRCACANPADHTCTRFCLLSSENAAIMLVNPSGPVQEKAEEPQESIQTVQVSSDEAGSEVLVLREFSDGARSDVLTALRNLVKANTQAMESTAHPRKRGSRVHKPGYR